MTPIAALYPEAGPGPGDSDALREWLTDRYAYPDPVPGRWVRVNMVTTLDGAAAGADGLSGSIGHPADRAVFSVLRGLADVVLVGSATARDEGYRHPAPKPAFATRRAASGQAPGPALMVLTRTGNVPDALLDDGRTLIAGPPGVRTRDGVPVLDRVGAERMVTVDPDPACAVADALDALTGRGLRRVLFEGGPRALGAGLAAGVVDELCVSQSPMVVAGGHPRIVEGPELDVAVRLAQLIVSEDMLLGRWLVQRVTTGDVQRS